MIGRVTNETPDAVDRFAEQWAVERPELDVGPMLVIGRLHRLAEILDQRLRPPVAAAGLGNGDFDVLAALRRSGPPYRLSPGQLLRETLVTSGTMTNRVDRLTDRGFVTRQDHPNDRRGVLVQLTETGRDAVDATLAALMSAERQVVSVLDVAQHDQLTRSLRLLLARHGSDR